MRGQHQWENVPPSSANRTLQQEPWIVFAVSRYSFRSPNSRASLPPGHEHLLFTVKPGSSTLRLSDASGRVVRVRVTGRIRTNQLRVVQLAAVGGGGIAALPLPLARPSLDEGRLLRVLPALTLRGARLYALYPRQAPKSPRVAAFLDAVASITTVSVASP